MHIEAADKRPLRDVEVVVIGGGLLVLLALSLSGVSYRGASPAALAQPVPRGESFRPAPAPLSAAAQDAPAAGVSRACVASGFCRESPLLPTPSFQGGFALSPQLAWLVGSADRPARPPEGPAMWRWDGMVWSPVALPRFAYMNAVWAAAADDVWGAGEGGMIYHFDGRAWTQQKVGQGPFSALFGVRLREGQGPSSDRLWAGDWDGSVYSFDGQKWSQQVLGAGLRIQQLWASGPDDAWALTTETAPQEHLFHCDGKSWTPVQLPSSLGDGAAHDISAMAGYGPASLVVWAANRILRFDGKTWTVMQGPGESGWDLARGMLAFGTSGAAPTSVLGLDQNFRLVTLDQGTLRLVRSVGTKVLFGSGPSDVWLAGEDGNLWHYDGRSLRSGNPVSTMPLRSVWGSDPGNVYVVGATSTVLHYDGKGWAALELPNNPTLTAVWGRSASEVWLMGRGVWHLDAGQSGGPLFLPVRVRFESAVQSLWGHSTGKSMDLYLATGAPRDARWNQDEDDPYARLAVHRFDGQWTPRVRLGKVRALRGPAIGGSGTTDLWLAGQDPAGKADDEAAIFLYHFDGQQWQSHRPTPALKGRVGGLWALAPSDVWLVGSGGILHYDGQRWQKQDSPANDELFAVWGRRADDVWAAGESGRILHYDGTRWHGVESGTDELLAALYGFSADGKATTELFAVGDHGTILHYRRPLPSR